jgi:putative transposase
LKEGIREQVISHILETSKRKNIYIDHINGYEEHLHALISMGGRQNISDIMKQIKGESSFWVNKHRLTRLKFTWQDDFYCVSFSMPQIDNLRDYVRNQTNHHKTVSWQEELEKLEKDYKIIRIRD